CAKGSKRIPLPQCLYPVTLATPVRNSPKRSSEYRTMKKISIGSWAYVFNQEHVADFHTVLHKLQDLKLDGVELGSFGIHPTPKSHPTKAARAALKKEVADHGLTFSGIAPDCGRSRLSVWKIPRRIYPHSWAIACLRPTWGLKQSASIPSNRP